MNSIVERPWPWQWRAGPAAKTMCLLAPLLYLLVWPGLGSNVIWQQDHFLALHTLLEIASVVASISVGLAAAWVLDEQRRRACRAVAVGFVAVGLLDALHLASYAGMPDLVSPNTSHKAIAFWLLARLVTALTLMAWCWPDGWRRLGPRACITLSSALAGFIATLAGLALLRPELLPPLFEPGEGLTPLKLMLEGGVGLLLAAALLAQNRRIRDADAASRADEIPVRDGMLLMLVGEGFFLIYADPVTDTANALGHAFKVVAYVHLCLGMFVNRVRRPYRQLAKANSALAERSAETRNLIELAPDGVVLLDAGGTMCFVNQAMELLFGYERSALLGRKLDLLLPSGMSTVLQAGRPVGSGADLARSTPRQRPALRGLRRDGTPIDVELALSAGQTADGWRITAFIADVSHRRAQEQALLYRATRDTTTALPNRACFAQLLTHAVSEAATRQQRLVLAIIDLDDFRIVNEAHGSAHGDRLLQSVARRLSSLDRPDAVAARLGSDEFALLLPETDLSASQLGASLCALLSDGVDGALSASIGLARWPVDAAEPEALQQAAELSLQAAKRAGRGSWHCYEPTFGITAARERRMRERLRIALDAAGSGGGGLVMHYQPQVALTSTRLTGFEALLRWTDSELGSVSPAEFVPLAERTGQINALGQFALMQALDQLARWRSQGLVLPVSVNLSPQQFRDPALAESIAEGLAHRDLPASLLAVEITEGAAMDDPAAAAAQLRLLAGLGVGVHLDDFGVGHSSLAWLKSFPVSAIKIDRGFVAEMERDSNDEAIVRAVVALAHTLGCRVIAEGIERPGQRERLRAIGCEEGQGWLFGRALSPPQATALIRSEIDTEAAELV